MGCLDEWVGFSCDFSAAIYFVEPSLPGCFWLAGKASAEQARRYKDKVCVT
jgi:hypothetical protein